MERSSFSFRMVALISAIFWLICIAVLLFLLYCWVAYSSFAMT